MDYSKLIISEENKREEERILQQVYNCIDSNKSFVYDTGAGAGKTYALKEALVYAIQKYGNKYEVHDQNILCITYTNVAVNEIKERLGNTSLVLVSTIHERMWNLIERHQKELVELHKEKLNEKIEKSNDFIKSNSESNWYRDRVTKKEEFYTNMVSKLSDYYKHYNKSADDFKQNFTKKYFGELNITNVSDFKNTVNKLLSLPKDKEAVKKIEEGKNEPIKYNIKINSDILHKFEISHDTVLEYAEKLICKYPIFQSMLADKYPIVFVDEYQDTNENVIKLINYIKEKSQEIKHPVCVGFFGDSKQNIYDTGVGANFYGLVEDYEIIENHYNRRSRQKIVEVANKIRNDSIKQKTIYENFITSNCDFYNEMLTEERIQEIKTNWNISKDNQLHCFLLKNESVAEKNGFKSVYDAFKPSYLGVKYDQLNLELFSDDEFKLGPIQLLFKKLIGFSLNVKRNDSLIYNVLNLKDIEYNITNVEELLSKFDRINGSTLFEYLVSFFDELKENTNEMEYILANKIFNLDAIKNKIIDVLLDDKENPETAPFLNLSITELINWYKYITNNFEDLEIVYQTLHSAKGLQYENVVINLDDNFAHDSMFFKRFFENYNKGNTLDEKSKLKYNKAQNLLYVGITRAINNLAVFYNYQKINEEIEKNIHYIFQS